jgi:hypothetical protein
MVCVNDGIRGGAYSRNGSVSSSGSFAQLVSFHATVDQAQALFLARLELELGHSGIRRTFVSLCEGAVIVHFAVDQVVVGILKYSVWK